MWNEKIEKKLQDAAKLLAQVDKLCLYEIQAYGNIYTDDKIQRIRQIRDRCTRARIDVGVANLGAHIINKNNL